MQAERWFEERHRAKVSKVPHTAIKINFRHIATVDRCLKLDMRAEDPTSAEDFKKQMTERFQKTVQVLLL